jgi:MFS family permease
MCVIRHSVQGIVLSSFYAGYIVTQVPGAMLAQRYGGRRVFGTGLVVVTICSLLTPVCGKTAYVLLVMIRVCMGFGGGVVYPAQVSLFKYGLIDCLFLFFFPFLVAACLTQWTLFLFVCFLNS